jgi:hypothetical protein
LIANGQGFARLLLVAAMALVGLGVWLVVAHSLWERPGGSDDPALMKRVNAATDDEAAYVAGWMTRDASPP